MYKAKSLYMWLSPIRGYDSGTGLEQMDIYIRKNYIRSNLCTSHEYNVENVDVPLTLLSHL